MYKFYYPSKDAWISESSSSSNFGYDQILEIGREYNIDNDFTGERWELDYLEDLEFLNKVFMDFGGSGYFGFDDILRYKRKHPEVFEINKRVVGSV